MGVAGFNGTANKAVYVSANNAAQDNFSGLFYVTADGAFVANPTVANEAWTDAQKVTKNSVTVYARLTDGGLYTEMLISGTKEAPTVNGANWYNNSYIAPWIAGAHYTVPANGKSVQRQITPSLNNLNLTNLLTYYKFGTTTGNATDGYVTKISMLVPFSAINGYAAGDKYVRLSVCVGEWGSGTVHVGTGGYTSSQNADYYENGYFVTASGMSKTAPATT
jgi:hypothetical protein